MNKYGVIMAGGGGTRFWPLSRQKTPKQLLNLTGKEIMVNEAIDRLLYTIDKENMFIVTNKTQKDPMLLATAGRILDNHILSEPSARNTAACIGYAAMEIVKKYGDGIMIITPSDAYIKDNAEFTKVLSKAVSAAEKNKLVTIGINPTFAATGYGYIKYNKNDVEDAKTVEEFKEKPTVEVAEEYIASGAYAWNSGMFIWKASVILEKFERYIPDIYRDLCIIADSMQTEKEFDVIDKVYNQIRSISVDYAIMEPAAANGEVLVVPGEFGWNDVGSWDMMKVLHDEDESGNITIGDSMMINTTNSFAYSSGKLVAVVGMDNVIVVETEDAIMVCNQSKAQDVKLVVDKLKEDNRTELL